MVGQLVLGLTLLVGIHEWGHMAAARFFGMRVEKFYIGFPPKIIGKKWGETEYALGAIPLGGFVKISGMIDESLDTSQLTEEPAPWEFRAKPAWQRLIVMLGGIIMNVVTGIVVFILIAYIYGDNYITKEQLNKNGIVVNELGKEIGLQNGDKIIAVNDADFTRDDEIFSSDNLVKRGFNIDIERGKEKLKIDVPLDFIERLGDRKNRGTIVSPRSGFLISSIDKKAADSVQLQPGDRILMAGDRIIEYYDQFSSYTRENTCSYVTLMVDRDGKTLEIEEWINHEGRIGLIASMDVQSQHEKFSLVQSLGIGTIRAFNVVWLNIQAFGKIFRGEVSFRKSISGPVRIAGMFGSEFRSSRFWYLVGLLSMVLAFMNLLPVPALDGGHVIFLTWEIITGKKPGDKFLENAQKFGMLLLLALMAFVIINDTMIVSMSDEDVVQPCVEYFKSTVRLT